MMTREMILDAAKECVCKDRENQYGPPENSFAVIGRLWEAYLIGRYGISIVITPKDVAMMMALLKVGRVSTGHNKDDNFIDLAGYAACAAEVGG